MSVIRERVGAVRPHRFAEGINAVIVNGTVAVDDGQWLGALSGQVLLRNDLKPQSNSEQFDQK